MGMRVLVSLGGCGGLTGFARGGGAGCGVVGVSCFALTGGLRCCIGDPGILGGTKCGEMMAGAPRFFVHRWNSVTRMVESVCSVCYATASSAPALAYCKEGEERHECPEWAVERWMAQREEPVSQFDEP